MVHMYPIIHSDGKKEGFAGGEVYLHRLNKIIGNADVYVVRMDLFPVITAHTPDHWVFDSVNVYLVDHCQNIPSKYDVYITHLGLTDDCVVLCKSRKARCVFISHFPTPYRSVKDDQTVRVIYNSQTNKQFFTYQNDGFILPPLLDTSYFDVTNNYLSPDDPYERPFITLVNTLPKKGGMLLKQMALQMPTYRFLAVTGGYFTNKAIFDYPKNVKVIPQTSDMREVYKQTRVLIFPTMFETWGMVASEALCGGIPIITIKNTDTKGLQENLKDAVIYLSNNGKVSDWIQSVKRLDNRKEYEKWKCKSLARAKEQDMSKYVPEFLSWFNS